MKFRRKSPSTVVGTDDPVTTGEVASVKPGPYSWDQVEGDGVKRVDLGSLLIPVSPDREIRLQVNEATQAVIAVQVVGKDGAVELRAFAAPRNGDLWTKARSEIAAESTERGTKVDVREGRFGTELMSQVGVDTPQGPTVMATRLVGVNGDRWLLRGSFLGQPAAEPETAEDWDEVFASVVVRRGEHALPVGEPLPLNLPTQPGVATQAPIS